MLSTNFVSLCQKSELNLVGRGGGGGEGVPGCLGTFDYA